MLHTIKHGKLEYLTADALEGSIHCFSTRYGGVSEGYLSSLNLGTHRGDKPENVYENYRILGSAVGFRPENTVFTKQLHTDIVRRVGRADRGAGLLREQTEVCDAQITDEPGVALVAFAADCTPILLFDPVRRAIAAVHAGWRGTALGIAAKAVEAMTREFGCEPENIGAAIGPCIGACCFEVGPEVVAAAEALLHEPLGALMRPTAGDRALLDLKGVNALRLTQLGVPAEQIAVSDACTMCRPDVFWSHRATDGRRGVQAAVITL